MNNEIRAAFDDGKSEEQAAKDINVGKFVLNDVIDSVIETLVPYAQINNNVIDVTLPNKLIFMSSDELKLKQILFNLISNACKHSENSKIKFTVSQKTKDKSKFITFKTHISKQFHV